MELEYKILQATTPMFARREKLDAVMEEEARAGWRLVEKFDSYRLRLQREISAREHDKDLDFDAYRTQIGISNFFTYSAAALATTAVVYLILVAVGAV